MIYYVILVSGVPEAVTTIHARALSYQKELSSANREATIVPCMPLEEEFPEEEKTWPDFCSCGSHLLDADCCCNK